MKIIFPILVLMFTMQARADSVLVHLSSYHSEKNNGYVENYNEKNYGIGYTLKSNTVIGGYYNSIKRASFYVAHNWKFSKVPVVYLRSGLVTGYYQKVSPMCGAVFEIPLFSRIYTEFLFMPKLKGITPAVLALSVGFRI